MFYVIIALAVLAVIAGVLAFIFCRLYQRSKKACEAEKVKLACLQQEYGKLVKAYEAKKKNKEKADEKVSDLHSGKLSADDILPKRKG